MRLPHACRQQGQPLQAAPRRRPGLAWLRTRRCGGQHPCIQVGGVVPCVNGALPDVLCSHAAAAWACVLGPLSSAAPCTAAHPPLPTLLAALPRPRSGPAPAAFPAPQAAHPCSPALSPRRPGTSGMPQWTWQTGRPDSPRRGGGAASAPGMRPILLMVRGRGRGGWGGSRGGPGRGGPAAAPTGRDVAAQRSPRRASLACRVAGAAEQPKP
jgi:hypothetical protein